MSSSILNYAEDQVDQLINAMELDLKSRLKLCKRPVNKYFSKFEQAKILTVKASAEQTPKAQAQESGETCAQIVTEHKPLEASVEDLQRQNQNYKAKIEGLTVDLNDAIQAKERLQHELKEYRSH